MIPLRIRGQIIGLLDADRISRSQRATQVETGEKGERLKKVWSGVEQAECVSLCGRFKESGIPFRVDQRRRQFLKGVDEHYQVWVPTDFFAKAQTILVRGRLDFTDDPRDLSVMELAEDRRADSADLLRSTSVGSSRATTIEVFSEEAPEKIWIVELSFRENAIEYRAEISTGGVRKLYVSPQNAALALEIVREIKSGTPPT